ncbi:MAG: indole-3-glycerol phosphate synthase TrpC [Chloroflexi bacterium]|nr:indole-3-glycerol phosphate synthase TrpC [Chloroflexota bacterium]
MASVLERIVAETRVAVEARKAAVPIGELCERARTRTQRSNFASALTQPGVGFVAEVKRGSPSRGLFAPDLSPGNLARIYCDMGAVAVSVLTSPAFFATDQDLCEAADSLAGSGVPLLRKEFHVDAYQVAEAAALGADAYLLIAKTLDADELTSLSRAGEKFGLIPFVEVTDEAETEMALSAGAAAIGINNRNLHTFEEDLSTTERLRDLIPPSVPVVAASGVRTRDDMKRMEACGVNAVLIGEALSSAEDPHAKARELLGR